MVDRERRLLEAAGHTVHQYFAPSSEESTDPAWRQAAAAVWNTRVTRQLTSEIASFRPTVLHVHTPFPLMSPAVFRSAHREGVPTVSTVHSYRYSCVAATLRRDGRICEDCVGAKLKLPAVRHRCYHDSLAGSGAMALSLSLHHTIGTFRRHVDCFLPLTEFSREILIRDGIPPDRVAVKPNFIDDPGPPVAYDEREPVVFFAGRLVEEKGIRTLLEGWRLAAPARHRLVVAGDGPLRDAVRIAADDDPSIELAGWLTAAEVSAFQRTSQLTVVPSEWYEAGPPLVLLEALAYGTPVLCSDLENICSTVVETRAGETFRTGDPVSFAKTLTAFLQDPSAAATMGKAARELYQRDHTAEIALCALEATYRRVAKPATR